MFSYMNTAKDMLSPSMLLREMYCRMLWCNRRHIPKNVKPVSLPGILCMVMYFGLAFESEIHVEYAIQSLTDDKIYIS